MKFSSLFPYFLLLGLCGVGVSLDVVSSVVGWGLGFREAGNAFFLLEFVLCSGFACLFYTVGVKFSGLFVGGRFISVVPVLFSFVPFVNNVMVMGGLI